MTTKTETIEELRNYLEGKGEEIEIDFFEDSKEVQSIKLDYMKLAKLFNNFFTQFRKDFKDFEPAKEIIKIYEPMFQELLRLYFDYNEDDFKPTRNSTQTKIRQKVSQKYYEIIDFIDMCMEVYGEE